MSINHISHIEKSYLETVTRIDALANYDWQKDAMCKGTSHLFFAPANERPVAKERREAVAKAICAICPVVNECLNHALVYKEQGLWGNTNDEERYDLYNVIPYAPVNTRFTRI